MYYEKRLFYIVESILYYAEGGHFLKPETKSSNWVQTGKQYQSQWSIVYASLELTTWTCFKVSKYVLFILYKFVKRFLAIDFLILLISIWNLHYVCQRVLCNQKRNFSWIRQKLRNFPKQIVHFGDVMSIDMTLPKGRFLQ